jgi:hypothetical protein
MGDLIGIFGGRTGSNIGDGNGYVLRHRPTREQRPGGQIELRCPPRGIGRDEVILKDTYYCQHWPCNRMVKLPHGTLIDDVGGHCKHCGGLICASCIKLGTCIPLEEGIERYEEVRRIRERMSADQMLRDMAYRREAQSVGAL